MGNGNNADGRNSFLAAWKDAVSIGRDTILLVLGILLLIFPQTFNSVLVEAGFEEGSQVGFRWKAKLEQSDQTLKDARATIADLIAQNEQLSRALAEAQGQIGDSARIDEVERLRSESLRLKEASEKVEAAVNLTIAANAPLVEKSRSESRTAVEWGVVYGGDTRLEDALFETGPIAEEYGLPGAAVYLRHGSYRSVVVTPLKSEAEQLMLRAKKRRSDAYIVNMRTWCPRTLPRDGYSECAPGA